MIESIARGPLEEELSRELSDHLGMDGNVHMGIYNDLTEIFNLAKRMGYVFIRTHKSCLSGKFTLIGEGGEPTHITCLIFRSTKEWLHFGYFGPRSSDEEYASEQARLMQEE